MSIYKSLVDYDTQTKYDFETRTEKETEEEENRVIDKFKIDKKTWT